MNTAELWIALSTVSAEGLWILGQGPRLLAHSQWEDSESHGLSETLELRLNQILENNGLKLQHIQRIGVVTGPGAFTGLRVSTAYTQGLARALSVPIFGITSFDLVGSPFFIPLRHQKTKLLSLAEYRV
jgi:tRNA threonylcarbamoyl adenosine modification protein YeaZ